MALIEIDNLTYTYPASQSPALHGVSLRVEAGELVGVVGANGAGKSTLCYALAGLAPRFFQGRLEGRVAVAGLEVSTTPPGRLAQIVGLALQNPLHQLSGARYSVFEEVAFGLENLGVERDEMRQRSVRALADVGLTELGERSPYELSGGQQQRLALAGLLAMDPAVLVLDEPTGMLDPQGCQEVYTLLARLQARGKAIVLAEHRLEWLAERANRVVLLAHGQIVMEGPPAEVLASATARLAGIGWTRFTQAAGWLAQRGRWPGGRPLPVTLASAVEGFRAAPSPGDLDSLRITKRGAPPTDFYGEATAKTGQAGVDIRLQAVTFSYPGGSPALKAVDVQISAGACAALIGANGSGKSTLARCLIGLALPQRGQVWLGDWSAAEHSTAQLARRVAYVFQNPDEQIFARSVWDEVAFGPRNLGCGRAEVEARVRRALEQTDLQNDWRTNPRDLDFSGRKRVALASALAMDTPVLALDEPTVGLDAAEIVQLGEILAALRRAGKTVLLITHDLDFAAEVCDWALLLADGRLARHGPAHEVLADVAGLEAHGLLAPQMARLGRALGQQPPATTVAEMIEVFVAGNQACW